MAARRIAASAWLIFALSASAQAPVRIFENAVELFGKRTLPEARQQFMRSLAIPHYAAESRYYLGRIALLEAKPVEAVKWLEPIALNSPPVFDAAAQLSRAYLGAGEIQRAKAMTERALQQAAWDGALHYRLGRIHQQLGEQEEARKEFAESVRLKTADRESVELLLECSQKLTSRAVADAMLIRQRLLDDPSLDPDVLVALGLTFTGAGLQAESLGLFQAAAQRDPAFLQAQYNAGLALLNLSRPAEAVGYLESARRLAPNFTEVYPALSVAYVLQARYQEAIPLLEKWRALQPANARALNMLGLAYTRANASARAVPVLREAIRLTPEDPKPCFLLVEALNATERQRDALQVAEDTLKRFPDLPQAHLANAQQLARLGQYEKAGVIFARAAELAPDRVDGLLGLAEARQKQGDYAASLETYRRALAIDPVNATAAAGAARCLVLDNRTGEARPVLEDALTANPDNAQLHYELSRVYARLGEKTLAAEQTQIFETLRIRESRTK